MANRLVFTGVRRAEFLRFGDDLFFKHHLHEKCCPVGRVRRVGTGCMAGEIARLGVSGGVFLAGGRRWRGISRLISGFWGDGGVWWVQRHQLYNFGKNEIFENGFYKGTLRFAQAAAFGNSKIWARPGEKLRKSKNPIFAHIFLKVLSRVKIEKDPLGPIKVRGVWFWAGPGELARLAVLCRPADFAGNIVRGVQKYTQLWTIPESSAKGWESRLGNRNLGQVHSIPESHVSHTNRP